MTFLYIAFIFTLSPWTIPPQQPATFWQGTYARMGQQGSKHFYIKRGAPFICPEFQATDNASPKGPVPVSVTGYVNPNKVGTYKIHALACDLCGNTTLLEVIYDVREKIP